MPCKKLPAEIWDDILGRVVPANWNRNVHVDWLVSLRLVCRTFDHAVSKELFLKGYGGWLHVNMDSLNVNTTIWLFQAKHSLGKTHHTLGLQSVDKLMSSLNDWKISMGDGIDEAHYNLYRKAAFSTMVAYNQVPWLSDMLDREVDDRETWSSFSSPSSSSSPSPSPLPLGPEHPLLPLIRHGGLTVAAFRGELSTVRAILQVGVDPSKHHQTFGYPIYAAAHGGHVEIMHMLLDAGASILGNMGRRGSPIEVAAAQGRLEAVQFLMSRGCDTTNVLADSLEGGHEHVAEWLLGLERDRIDINIARRQNQAPILFALARRCRSATKLLAERLDLQPNVQDAESNTPLCLAIEYGWMGIAKMLLRNPRIDPTLPGREGETPLHAACRTRDSEMVRLMLLLNSRHVNCWRNVSNKTPLALALRHGTDETIELLLGHAGIRLTAGQPPNTALEVAIRLNRNDIVRRLLADQDVRGSLFAARTGFCMAVRQNNAFALQLLLDLFRDCNRINSNLNSGFSRVDSFSQLDGIYEVEIFLNWEGAYVDLLYNGRTLTTETASWDCQDVIRLLLSRFDVELATREGSPGHALLGAVVARASVAARTMLQRPGIDPNSSGPPNSVKYNIRLPRACLIVDSEFPHYRYAFLSRPGRVDPAPAPLSVAATTGQFDLVDLFLAHPAANPNVVDGFGRTALWWVVGAPEDVAPQALQQLLACSRVDPNKADHFGWTPLLLAVYENALDLAVMLLAHPDINPNQANHDGWTPLLMAVSCNRINIAAQLIMHASIDIDKASSEGVTPLQLARQTRRDVIAAMLEAVAMGVD